MAENDIKITPSVIDRLIDYEPKNTREAPKSRTQSLKELKQAVLRDVEWLLNTKISQPEIPEGLEEVHKSLAMYGLRDFVGMSSKDSEERKKLVKSVETALRQFEPRFMNLSVKMKDLDTLERGVRFQIEARLKVEPTPEPIVFDTVLKMGSGDFEVKEA